MDHTNESLSNRGSHIADNPSRADMDIFFEAVNNPFHPEDNPEGSFPLSVAENAVTAPFIRAKLREIMIEKDIPEWVMQYTSPLGHPDVRAVFASFMRTHLGSEGLRAENIVLSAGACASLEVTAFALANPGDVVVIPAPAYPMYTSDLGMKSGMERHDLQTHFDIEGKKSLALITADLLEKTKKEIHQAGKNFRMLLLTTPDNPTGSRYTETQLRDIAQWCVNNRIHLVVNEIYAFSAIDIDAASIRDDYPQSGEYSSFATIIDLFKSDYLHLVYALSKDFAMSGLRVGFTHSYNERFIKSLESINIPHMVSNVTQWVVAELFADNEFINDYLEHNKQQITKSYQLMVETLRSMQIPYAPAMGSLFVWVDLSTFLKSQTNESEHQLWLELYQQTGLLLTPGAGFGHRKKGMFRIVYMAVPFEHLKVAMHRLQKFRISAK